MFDAPGASALRRGALPRNCHVSLEAGGRMQLPQEFVDRFRYDDRIVYDKFAVAVAAVGAARGSLSHVSTYLHLGNNIGYTGYHAAALTALAANWMWRTRVWKTRPPVPPRCALGCLTPLRTDGANWASTRAAARSATPALRSLLRQ